MRITPNTISKVYRAQQCDVDTMEALGFELVDNIMVDNSGFGQPGELADTPSQFEARLRELLAEHGTLTAKITGVGQFQVYVGLFTRTGVKTGRKLASNTYLIERDGKRVVRLYKTDILTDNGDGTLTVDNGGYATRTTHKRIMEFSSLHANSKNWETNIYGTPLSERQTFPGSLRV